MNRHKHILALLSLSYAFLTAPVYADEILKRLNPLQRQWAEINYETPKDDKAKAFEALVAEADSLIESAKGRPEPLIWKAIILSTKAGVDGGLGALSQVKEARDLLLEAEKIDSQSLQGSVYTSLGSLYYQVPGWPIGFGDDDKAESYLKKALEINPDGIDPNYFYADFLFAERRYADAAAHAEMALQAPDRPDRPVADKGRRAEAQVLLEKIKVKLTASNQKSSGGSLWN